LLVAPYLTREVAERCRQLHLPFIDTAGNAYFEGPGLLVYVIGNNKPAELRQDHFRALNPAGLQIAFALVSQPALVQTTYREIAARAGVALGTVGPVMKDLEARGYLRFQRQPDRKLLDPEHMVEEWVTHHPITLRQKLNARRFRADMERLQQADLLHQNAHRNCLSSATLQEDCPAGATFSRRSPRKSVGTFSHYLDTSVQAYNSIVLGSESVINCRKTGRRGYETITTTVDVSGVADRGAAR
jgi:hypothetical protein